MAKGENLPSINTAGIEPTMLPFSSVRVVQSLVFCVVLCRSLFTFLSVFFCSYYCLFFQLWFLITALVSLSF